MRPATSRTQPGRIIRNPLLIRTSHENDFRKWFPLVGQGLLWYVLAIFWSPHSLALSFLYLRWPSSHFSVVSSSTLMPIDGCRSVDEFGKPIYDSRSAYYELYSCTLINVILGLLFAFDPLSYRFMLNCMFTVAVFVIYIVSVLSSFLLVNHLLKYDWVPLQYQLDFKIWCSAAMHLLLRNFSFTCVLHRRGCFTTDCVCLFVHWAAFTFLLWPLVRCVPCPSYTTVWAEQIDGNLNLFVKGMITRPHHNHH